MKNIWVLALGLLIVAGCTTTRPTLATLDYAKLQRHSRKPASQIRDDGKIKIEELPNLTNTNGYHYDHLLAGQSNNIAKISTTIKVLNPSPAQDQFAGVGVRNNLILALQVKNDNYAVVPTSENISSYYSFGPMMGSCQIIYSLQQRELILLSEINMRNEKLVQEFYLIRGGDMDESTENNVLNNICNAKQNLASLRPKVNSVLAGARPFLTGPVDD